MSVIHFDNVSFHYPGSEREVIKNLSLAVNPGEIVAVIGQNGAGKSTLFKLALSEAKPTQGRVLFNNHPVASYSKKDFAQKIVSINQRINRSLFMDLTLNENIKIWRYRFNITSPLETFSEGLIGFERLKAHMKEPVSSLSGGEQQMFLSSLIFSVPPELLFLDEHTSQLDLHKSHEVMADLLKNARKHNTTILMITHDLSDALQYADRIIVLRYNASALQYIPSETTLEAIKKALL